MKRLIADIHMHTLASGHAYGTIREMAAAAKEQQLQLIGISEHAPGIPGTVDPFYYGNLRVIPRVIDGVEILHGCEINVLKRRQALAGTEVYRPIGLCHCGHPWAVLPKRRH